MVTSIVVTENEYEKGREVFEQLRVRVSDHYL